MGKDDWPARLYPHRWRLLSIGIVPCLSVGVTAGAARWSELIPHETFVGMLSLFAPLVLLACGLFVWTVRATPASARTTRPMTASRRRFVLLATLVLLGGLGFVLHLYAQAAG